MASLSLSLDTPSDRSLRLHRRGSPRRRTSHLPSLNPRVVFVGLVARVEPRERFVVRSGEGEADEDDDEVTKAIEKNKKALALQKDLLEQIVERRKLVSSLKDSKIDNETDISSDSKEDKSLPEANKSPKSTYFSRESPKVGYSGSAVNKRRESVNKSPVQSLDAVNKSKESVDKSMVQSSVAVNKQKESADKSPVQRSVASALGLRRETDSAINESKKMMSSLQTAKPDKARTDQLSTQQEKHVVSQSDSQESSSEEGSSTSPPLAGANVMNVILVAAECSPWIKTGGLGDVAGALPKALAKRGHRVMVVVPRYGNYAEAVEVGQRRRYKVDGQDMEIAYYHTFIDGVDFVFIDSPIFSHRENNIYGGERKDILKRMVLFCKAAIEVPWHVPCGGVCYGDGNLVFIANDWHTALLPVYLKAYYRDNGLMMYTRSVLVIHNIAHQGRGPVDDFALTNLPGHYIDLFKMDDPVGGEHFNIFAAGLKTADRIVTVSHGYTWELKTPEGGWGLHSIINENDWKLQGIVNGIDVNDWNPEIDVHLQTDGYTNYSIETLKAGKGQCKAALQRELGLPVRNEAPVIGFIGRLDHQKGVDLIAEAIPWMVSQDMQLIMLGTGRQDLEEMLRRFEGQHQDKIRSWVGFSVKTAHRITAGADILLMPSRFEPCGLNQLYAMKYGTIPVVHSVGGLRETVQQFDPFNESGYGWTFDRAESSKLIDALGHSLNTYWNYKESWEGLRRRGMQQDLSWDNVAQHYEDVLVKAKYQW